jgi:hypothetical protein
MFWIDQMAQNSETCVPIDRNLQQQVISLSVVLAPKRPDVCACPGAHATCSVRWFYFPPGMHTPPLAAPRAFGLLVSHALSVLSVSIRGRLAHPHVDPIPIAPLPLAPSAPCPPALARHVHSPVPMLCHHHCPCPLTLQITWNTWMQLTYETFRTYNYNICVKHM